MLIKDCKGDENLDNDEEEMKSSTQRGSVEKEDNEEPVSQTDQQNDVSNF